MADRGFFGGLFDLNGDGKLDSFEQAMDFAAFMSIMEDEEKEKDSDDLSLDDESDDDEFDEDEFDVDEYDEDDDGDLFDD